MYNSIIQSVIDYCACSWGHREFSCINAVLCEAIHSFLELHKKMLNAAALVDVIIIIIVFILATLQCKLIEYKKLNKT